MLSTVRTAVAHAATPWEWRSDAAIWLLVGCMSAIPIIVLASGVRRGLGEGDGGTLVGALIAAGVYYLLLTRPALRSWRRRKELAAMLKSA